MNPTISADALVAAALWLLALGLPLAMLLWMAAQYVALRSLGRRLTALEARAGAAPAADPPAEPEPTAPPAAADADAAAAAPRAAGGDAVDAVVDDAVEVAP